jgi:hypothetical protein
MNQIIQDVENVRGSDSGKNKPIDDKSGVSDVDRNQF